MDKMDASIDTGSESVQQSNQPVKEYLSIKELCKLIPFAESTIRNKMIRMNFFWVSINLNRAEEGQSFDGRS